MTREEIIEQLESIIGTYEILTGDGVNSDMLGVDDIDAIREAIEALEAEPCVDVISRQAALDCCTNGWNKDFKEIMADIRALPPAQKMGRWIKVDNVFFRCSECDAHRKMLLYGYMENYCPNCGARMVLVDSGGDDE